MTRITRQTFDEVMFPCYTPMDMVVARGKGSRLYDTEGREYLDLTAGIAVNAFGHCDEGLVAAIARASANLMHTSNIFTNTSTLGLALELTAATGLDRAFFVNSGAEANEAALKLARRYAFDTHGKEKDEIISFNDSFHGRTLFSVTVGGHEEYTRGFGPLPGAITHLPYNDCEALRRAVSSRTCAVILEPIQGEGGIHPATEEFLRTARELCDQHQALLIMDEIQTGMGRTGHLLACERHGVRPDILTLAKALAGGLPIGAVLARGEVAMHLVPGTHGSTFGGNPLACEVARYALGRINTPAFLARVGEAGQRLRAGLEELGRRLGCFTEVRGAGLLLGAELQGELQGKSGAVQRECFAEGLLILVAGQGVLRFTPPLNISDHDIDEALSILGRVLSRHRAG
ncbi:MAG: acetylornithine/succinyldiaminopimelate transaminase [Succinivibrionaceae bacterium]|nr:acetylornithine/succinyldiaminopimelate transaminase [Succinivibrionaceae bacterium]